MLLAAAVVRAIRSAGLGSCDVFTGAGTGTHEIDVEVSELTDLQCGSYVLMDAEYFAVASRTNQTPSSAATNASCEPSRKEALRAALSSGSLRRFPSPSKIMTDES